MNDIKEIAAALCKFQKNMPVLKKTGQNFTKGTAATIGDVVTIAMKGSEFGLSFSQKVHHRVQPDTGVTTCFVETIMMHTSGQWLSSGEYPITPAKPNDPASFGSAQTYAKKNSLQAVYGIADHNDDDVDWDLGEEGIKDDNDEPPKTSGEARVQALKKPVSNLPLDEQLAACRNHAERIVVAERFFNTGTPQQRQPTIDEAKLFLNLTEAGDLMSLFNTMRPENQIIIDMFTKRQEGKKL